MLGGSRGGQIPGGDLFFHASILFFHVPYFSFEGTVLFFDLVDDTLELIIFIPNDVLCVHVAFEVDIGMKDVMVGVDFLFEIFFIFNSLIKSLLPSLKYTVIRTQHQQRLVIQLFHFL